MSEFELNTPEGALKEAMRWEGIADASAANDPAKPMAIREMLFWLEEATRLERYEVMNHE